MNLHLKTKVYYFKKSLIYLKNYKRLVVLAVSFSLLASLFDGFSIGALIPFLQSLTSFAPSDISTLPIFQDLQQKIIGTTKEEALVNILIFALGMIILRSIFNYLRIIVIEKTKNLIKRDLQSNIFNAITDSSLSFYQNTRSGNLVSSMSTYTNSIVAFIFVLLNLVSNISKILVYIIFLIFISWQFTLLVAFIELLFFPFIRFILNKIKRTSYQITQEVGNIFNQMIEMLQSIPLIKISGTENYEKQRFSDISTNLANLTYQQSKQTSFIPLVTEVFVMLSIIFLLISSIKIFQIDIVSYLPFIIAYLYIFLRLFSEINVFLRSISGMFEHAPAFKTYEDNLNIAKRMALPNGDIKLDKLKDSIEFKNITFGYNQKCPVLNNINLTFPQGSFTAIIGPTGTGKTTIVNLISGLFFVDEGSISIDGINIKDLDIKTWRHQIGYIPQDSIIFNDTIANNIAYGFPNATITDIKAAAKVANIDEFIEELPDKYQTTLGERGTKLSGGQRQRISIARAIIRNPKVLILDEATSALDTKTEKSIQKAFEQAQKGRTVIAIAHRLSTILKADNIVVLNDGLIIESGDHQELITKNGAYKKYYDLQFKH